MPGWLTPSLVAALVVVVAVPRLRLRTAVVDLPDDSTRSVPPAAGAALIPAVLGALLFESQLGPSGALVFLVGALLGGVGLLDAAGTRGSFLQFAAGCGAAVVAVALGVRVPPMGSTPLDLLLTMSWIVFFTHGFAVLHHFDGVAAGMAAVACLGIFVVALLADQAVVGTVAAATAAACLAFLVFNRPPAWVRMGAGGSLFLGFVLAILTLSVDPQGSTATRLVVPALLLALPAMLVGATTLDRLRYAATRSGELGSRPAPRLVCGDRPPARALALLVAAEAVMVALAVLLGAGTFPIVVPVILAMAVLAAVRATGITVHRSGAGRVTARRSTTPVILLLGLGCLVVSVPAVIALLRVAAPAQEAQATAKRATAALEGGDAVAAVAEFERAAEQFSAAKSRLSGPLPQLSTVVPVLSANVSAAKGLVSVGEDLARAGSAIGRLLDPDALPIVDGTVLLDEVRGLSAAFEAASGIVQQSQARLRGIPSGFLVPSLGRAVEELSTLLEDNEHVLELGAETAQVLPSLLGEQEPKRYFLAFQNPSELRGTGGFIGNWGELVADSGRLRLERFGRLNELQWALTKNGSPSLPEGVERRWGSFGISRQWQQVNVSPDFATTASVIDAMYLRSGGQPVDGVIAIDPVGLSALLRLTGPVTVPSWPEPITSANVVDVTLVRAYERFPLSEDALRIAFLGDVAHAVTQAFTRLHVSSARELVTSLGAAVRGRHLMVYAKEHRAEQLMRKVGADGGVPVLEGDSLLVVNQNMAGNKIDAYLRRHVRYDVEIVPRGGAATVSGRAEVSLVNAVPSLGLPEAVIGPYLPQFRAGENRSYVSLYAPFLAGGVSVDGEPVDAESHLELGRPSNSVTLSLDAGQTRTVGVSVRGTARLGDRTWYRLELLRQPTLNPDTYDVAISVPPGWRIADVRGVPSAGSERRTTVHLETDEVETLWVKIEPTGINRLWDRLLG